MTGAAPGAVMHRVTAANDNECEDTLLGEWACSTLNDIPGVNWLYGKLGDVQRANVDATMEALEGVVPDNFIEQWVKGMAESTVSLLSHVQALGERVSTPAFGQRWWVSQYATSFGLSLLLLALLLVWITARFAASGSSASAIDLFRQSGWRLVFVVPLISAGPAILLHVQLAANELARAFADEGRGRADSAVEALMDLLTEETGNWGLFGGTVLALLLLLFILCLGLVTMIEMAIAQWGLQLGALLVPLALVAWVYPPWSGMLRRLVALIGGLLLLPAFFYFFFTTIWTSFDALIAGDEGDDGLSILLFLTVGLLMIDAFPLVAMWLMSLTASPGAGMDPEVRGVVQHPSGGEMAAAVVERFEARTSQIGAARGSGYGGSDDENDDDDAGPGERCAAGRTSDRDREQGQRQDQSGKQRTTQAGVEPTVSEPYRAGGIQDTSGTAGTPPPDPDSSTAAAGRSATHDEGTSR